MGKRIGPGHQIAFSKMTTAFATWICESQKSLFNLFATRLPLVAIVSNLCLQPTAFQLVNHFHFQKGISHVSSLREHCHLFEVFLI
jgi:hypothetical protein